MPDLSEYGTVTTAPKGGVDLSQYGTVSAAPRAEEGPPLPAPPIPRGLQTTEERLNNAGALNIHDPGAGLIGQGYRRAAAGVAALTRPTVDEKAHAASEIIRGAGTMAIPAVAPVTLADLPAAVGAGLAGYGGSKLARGLASYLEAGPGVQDLAEDVGGGLGIAKGGKGVRAGLKAMAPKKVNEVLQSIRDAYATPAEAPAAPAGPVPAPSAAPVPAPVSAPKPAPQPIEDIAALDEISKSLGGGKFIKLPQQQQAAVRAIHAGRAASATATTGPVPAPGKAATPPVQPQPVAATPPAPPPAPVAQPAPVAPVVPAEAPTPQGATSGPGEGFDYKHTARSMRAAGTTRADIVANRDSLLRNGYDADRYNRLLSEVGQQEKDHAILDKLANDGITTEEQIRGIPDEDLEKTVNGTPKKNGKGNYRSKSGDHSRSMKDQREDLIQELQYRPKPEVEEE